MTTLSIETTLMDERKWWKAIADHTAELANIDSQSYYTFQTAQKKLVAVDRALQRIEVGTFGWCDVCGERIEPERLELLVDSDCHTCAACAAAAEVRRNTRPMTQRTRRTDYRPVFALEMA